MKYFITGGCGFLGSNLAHEVLKQGEELIIIDNLSRLGSENNLNWLKTLGDFEFLKTDMRSREEIAAHVKRLQPDVIFHLAGQVAMTTSLANPRQDFEINVVGGNNLLEAVREYSPSSILTYSSTNKVYGDLGYLKFEESESRYICPDFPRGFDEMTRVDFQSPYGCSKGAIDQYMLDYARNFSLKTIVFRHSSIFGARQFSTFDQGWVGWFIRQAINQKCESGAESFTVSGNGKQVRDILFSGDLVRCYFQAIQAIDSARGQAFNIGGGIENSLSLLELFSFLESEFNIRLRYDHLPPRTSDQKIFVADTTKAQSLFDFKVSIPMKKGLREMIDWVRSNEFKS